MADSIERGRNSKEFVYWSDQSNEMVPPPPSQISSRQQPEKIFTYGAIYYYVSLIT